MQDEYSAILVDDFCKFNAVKDDWNKLAAQYGEECFFMSHGWYELWLNHFLKDSKLCIITVYKNDNLIAIAPFIWKNEVIKRIPVIKLETIGNAYSPLRSLIIDRTEKKQKMGSVLFEALKKVSGWDIAQIGPIYDGELYSETKKVIKNMRYSWLEKVVDTNWRLPSEELNYDEYLRTRNKDVRQEIKRRNKKLEELGAIEIKIVRGDEAVGYISAYCTVYEKSWKQAEKLGPGFHINLAKLAACGNNLLLALLYLDGVPIAAQYRILCGNKCYFLKTAYDSSYQRYSVGVILLNYVLKYLMNIEHIKDIDFGPGDETYKSDWADHKNYYNNIYIFNGTMKGSLIHFAYTKIEPFARKFIKGNVQS